MKKILFVLAFLSCGTAKADCAASGLYFYPTTNEVNTNSLFYIEGYYMDQEFIRKIGSKYTVKLVSKNESIELENIDLYEGMMHLTIVSLQPIKELTKDESYTLKIYDKEENEKLVPKRYEKHSREWTEVKYKATKTADKTTPQLIEMPNFNNSTFTPFGCGPAKYANFNCKIEDESEVLVLIKLKNLKTEEINIYPVLFQDEMIQIGHGMCSGPFTFESDVQYVASFSMMDICGNSVEKWTGWMKLTNPNEVGYSY